MPTYVWWGCRLLDTLEFLFNFCKDLRKGILCFCESIGDEPLQYRFASTKSCESVLLTGGIMRD